VAKNGMVTAEDVNKFLTCSLFSMEDVAKLIRAEDPHIYIRNIMIGKNFLTSKFMNITTGTKNNCIIAEIRTKL
jgi:hypothetical protein